MTYRPTPRIHAAIRFTWDRLDYLVLSMCAALGLGMTGAKPFLPRWQLAELRRFLAHAEPLLRRVLALMAASAGPLAARVVRPRMFIAPAPKPRPGPAHRPLFPTPHFRLSEAPLSAAPRTPPPPRYRTGPRIRRLDVDLPVDLSEYPALDTDILPASRLVRRLQALGHVFDNFDHYLDAMRRKLADASPPLRAALPPAFRRGPLSLEAQQTACALHDAALGLCPDTS